MLEVDVSRGVSRRCLRAVGVVNDPDAVSAERDEVALRVAPDWNRLVVLSALATGFLPWGEIAFPTQLAPCIQQRGGRYPVSSCFSFTIETVQIFVDAGLLAPAEWSPDALVITEAGRLWLMENWHRMLAQPESMASDDCIELFKDAKHEPRPMRGRGRSIVGKFRC